MDIEQARKLLDHFAAAYNEGDLAQLDLCLSPDYQHPNPAVTRGIQGMREAVTKWRTAVESPYLRVDDVIAGDDKVVARMTFSGRQVGEILGIPATGRKFSFGLIDIFLVENGLFVRHWDEMDLLGMFRQLGAIPE
jgi:steroid delta-isomerase-like uncharacterized protein